ncbi:hypothetical protein [Draconibacterium sediminis]|uniref:Uncharacterized protein n=1 Tax=Draconibacterium sediminis TaxID=1544798 RepID=A0A0D8JAG2_9BACT|nr:hypothetical protein [Draconibacterium sediminis]KJF43709.1 hypothetical protein LH29_11500 [Draconibacterium sediminis]
MRKFFNFLGLAAIILSTTLFSCDKDDTKDSEINKCNVTNPIEELAWLNEEIENVIEDEYSYYNMASYQGQTVFFYGNCHPAINYVSIVRNCTGDSLDLTINVYDELTEITTIWKHENTECNFAD